MMEITAHIMTFAVLAVTLDLGVCHLGVPAQRGLTFDLGLGIEEIEADSINSPVMNHFKNALDVSSLDADNFSI